MLPSRTVAPEKQYPPPAGTSRGQVPCLFRLLLCGACAFRLWGAKVTGHQAQIIRLLIRVRLRQQRDRRGPKVAQMRGRKSNTLSQLILNGGAVPAHPIPQKAQGLPIRRLRQRVGQENFQFFSFIWQLPHGRHSRRKYCPVYLPCPRILNRAKQRLPVPHARRQRLQRIHTHTGLAQAMQSDPGKTNGYPVCADDTNYVDEFTTAAMALAKVGDVSEPFQTQYGIHIVKYVSDITEGAVPLDEVKDTVSAEVLKTKQDDLYQTTLDQWITEANAKTYKDRLAD